MVQWKLNKPNNARIVINANHHSLHVNDANKAAVIYNANQPFLCPDFDHRLFLFLEQKKKMSKNTF